LEELARLVGAEPLAVCHLMVEARIVEQVPDRDATTEFRVSHSPDHSCDPGEDERSRAHVARLHGRVDRRTEEASISARASRRRDGEELGVRGRIAPRIDAVVVRREHGPIEYHHGPDRDLVLRRGSARFLQGERHELRVLGIVRRRVQLMGRRHGRVLRFRSVEPRRA
jgi:hypothetical protein